MVTAKASAFTVCVLCERPWNFCESRRSRPASWHLCVLLRITLADLNCFSCCLCPLACVLRVIFFPRFILTSLDFTSHCASRLLVLHCARLGKLNTQITHTTHARFDLDQCYRSCKMFSSALCCGFLFEMQNRKAVCRQSLHSFDIILYLLAKIQKERDIIGFKSYFK